MREGGKRSRSRGRDDDNSAQARAGTGRVSRRFGGEYTFKVDAKGRVSIPARFRRLIEADDPDFTDGLRPQFTLVYGPKSQNHLKGYTIKELQKLQAKVARLPNSPLKRRLIDENFAKSHDAEIDPDGRLVLPAWLRERVGLSGEAMIVGTMDTFEIWEPATYEASRTTEDEDLGFELPEGIDPMDALDLVLAQRGDT